MEVLGERPNAPQATGRARPRAAEVVQPRSSLYACAMPVRGRRAAPSPATTPVFILIRDRLTPLLELVGWLERTGFERIHLLDNDSAYKPLLEYLAVTPHDVVRLGRNVGKHALWLDPRLGRIAGRRPLVYTDPDVVPVPECPPDALDRFVDLLSRHRDVTKVGFGLRIDDLPDHYRFKEDVLAWERQFWADELEVEPGVYRAPIDTTFALYRRWIPRPPPIDALRTGFPYVAQHTTWYIDSAAPPEEERFYEARLARGTDDSPGTSSWTGERLPEGLVRSIARLRGTQNEHPPP